MNWAAISTVVSTLALIVATASFVVARRKDRREVSDRERAKTPELGISVNNYTAGIQLRTAKIIALPLTGTYHIDTVRVLKPRDVSFIVKNDSFPTNVASDNGKADLRPPITVNPGQKQQFNLELKAGREDRLVIECAGWRADNKQSRFSSEVQLQRPDPVREV